MVGKAKGEVWLCCFLYHSITTLAPLSSSALSVFPYVRLSFRFTLHPIHGT